MSVQSQQNNRIVRLPNYEGQPHFLASKKWNNTSMACMFYPQNFKEFEWI